MIRKGVMGALGGMLLLAGCATTPSSEYMQAPTTVSIKSKIEQEIRSLMTGESSGLSISESVIPPGVIYPVQPGDTASAILRRAGAPQGLIQSLPAQDIRTLGALQPGNRLMLLKDGESFVGIGLEAGAGWRIAIKDHDLFALRDNVSFEPPRHQLFDIPLRGTLKATLEDGGTLSPEVQVALQGILARGFDDSRLPEEGWLRLRMIQPVFEGIPQGVPILVSAALADVELDESLFIVRIEAPGQPVAYYDGDGKRLTPSWLARPIEGEYRITSGFNPARRHPITGRVRPHNGKDFAASTGTPVLAASDATVAYAGWRGSWGNLIVLQHAGGIESRYAHLSSIEGISAGDTVSQGDTIGQVGSTGLSSGPHLHFEVYLNGRAQDPASFNPSNLTQGAGAQLAGVHLEEVETYLALEEQALAFLPGHENHGLGSESSLMGVGGPLAEDEDLSQYMHLFPIQRTLERQWK